MRWPRPQRRFVSSPVASHLHVLTQCVCASDLPGDPSRLRLPEPPGDKYGWLHSQFVYVLLVGTFPFNSVLAGMLSSLGFLTLTGASADMLRVRTDTLTWVLT